MIMQWSRQEFLPVDDSWQVWTVSKEQQKMYIFMVFL